MDKPDTGQVAETVWRALEGDDWDTAAGLLLAGAAVNGLGIRNPAPTGRHLGPAAEQPPPGVRVRIPSGPIQAAPQQCTKQQPQADPTSPARPD